MKSKLQFYKIPVHTSEWYSFRRRGIGGSEIGTVMGLDPYNTRMRVYAEKIGEMSVRDEDNNYMFWGREHEDKIAEVWQYWDGTEEGYISNLATGKKIRTSRRVNGYLVNPEYPWLFGSLDRLMIQKGGFNMLTGKPLDKLGILECKSLSYWAANAWEDGLPIYFLAQIHLYMIVTGSDYAEIAILKDGNRFDVEYIEKNEDLCQRVIDVSKDFWFNRVVPAKEAMKRIDDAYEEGDIQEVERNKGIIQSLEPDPDGTEAYQEFMSDRFKNERENIQGTMETFSLAKRDEVLRKIESKIKKERLLIKNNLLKFIVESGAEYVDFGSHGGVKYFVRKGAKNRSLMVALKEKPPENIIENEFGKINQNCY